MQPYCLDGLVVQGPQGRVTHSCPHMREWLGHHAGPQKAMPSRREHLVVELHLLFLTLVTGDTKDKEEGVKMGSRVTEEELRVEKRQAEQCG